MLLKINEANEEKKRLTPTRKREIVTPIRDPEDIQRVRRNLKDRSRDLLLFDLATQTGLRMKLLINLKVKDLGNVKVGERLFIYDKEGNYLSDSVMNETIYRTFQLYLKKENLNADDFLFKSRKGAEPLSLTSVSHLVRKWFDNAGLKGLSGASSLRKTWEFHNQNNFKMETAWGDSREPEQVLKPVRKATLQEAVYREIKQAILTGRIPPGGNILTEKIARQTNVSETPAREALTRLEAEGIVWRSSRKGHVVKELSSRDLREILRIRLVLETMAMREACGKISVKTLRYLENIFRQYKQARKDTDIDKYFLLNKDFHNVLYSAADMPTLKIIIELLWDKMSPYLNLLIRECEDYDPRRPWECHRGILDGIKDQSPDEACKWLETDLTRAAETLTKWLDQGQSKGD